MRDLLKGRRFDVAFDFIYASGLYDYLEQPVARRLTAALFDQLAPGGRLLVANFLPDHLDVGYMEAFMDWWLIYRSPAELADVAADIPAEQLAAIEQWDDPWRSITYLELERG